jgi:hypothetical protein
MKVTDFYHALWQDYISITPQARAIHALFSRTDGVVINDHVAFRTFAGTALSLDQLEPVILSMGYERQDTYFFKEKKLKAHSFIHPDGTVPKVFCSELLVDQLSDQTQAILKKYTDQIEVSGALTPEVFWSARHWSMPSFDDYQAVLSESEYGAWLLAIGLRVNHFTVSVNHLKTCHTVQEVLHHVKTAGFGVNTVGGEVKGSKEALLEQGSTLADKQSFEFAGGESYEIPTCFYEFALRHADNDGVVYQGFREANADKIFESTNAR